MKKSKLIIIITAAIVAVSLNVAGIVFVTSNLEKNNMSANDPLLKRVNSTTLEYNGTRFEKGGTVTVKDKSLSQCLLIVDKDYVSKELFTSRYAPLFEKEQKTNYYLRKRGNVILEKNTLAKSEYTRYAYTKATYELPELKTENIKNIDVCYGDFYDKTSHIIDDFAIGVAATVDGDCTVFNSRRYHEIDNGKEIEEFVTEFRKTGGLENFYKKWSDASGKDNIFFKVEFFKEDLPCSLLFTKDAITVD